MRSDEQIKNDILVHMRSSFAELEKVLGELQVAARKIRTSARTAPSASASRIFSPRLPTFLV
jgi:hypothetical protein